MVTNHHKLISILTGPLPVGGITSAYEQKCSRSGQTSDISGFFQLAIFGSQTQQPVENYTRPEQSKLVPQGRKIQNGDTGNHQDFPPRKGVGHLNRLQRCLLLHTNTGTVQEIYEVSHPGSVISVQGTAIQTVYSFHGVLCDSKWGKTALHKCIRIHQYLDEWLVIKPLPILGVQIGTTCYEDKLQELNTDFAEICISTKPSGAPMGKVPLPVVKEFEHQAWQNLCTLNFLLHYQVCI